MIIVPRWRGTQTCGAKRLQRDVEHKLLLLLLFLIRHSVRSELWRRHLVKIWWAIRHSTFAVSADELFWLSRFNLAFNAQMRFGRSTNSITPVAIADKMIIILQKFHHWLRFVTALTRCTTSPFWLLIGVWSVVAAARVNETSPFQPIFGEIDPA